MDATALDLMQRLASIQSTLVAATSADGNPSIPQPSPRPAPPPYTPREIPLSSPSAAAALSSTAATSPSHTEIVEEYDPFSVELHAQLSSATVEEATKTAQKKADAVLQRLPSGWMECYDDVRKRNYWFNKKTGESAWTRPSSAGSASASTQMAESDFVAGQRHFKNQMHSEAVLSFTKAIEARHPDRKKVFSWRGVANDFLKRHDDALRDHSKAIEPVRSFHNNQATCT